MTRFRQDLNTALAEVEHLYKDRIGHNDHLFLSRIFRQGLGKYTSRLRAIGFCNQSRVLDAGCGYGQWSLALSEMNQCVSGCDISPLRIDFLRDLASRLGLTNLDLHCTEIDRLPFPDDWFDAVFCYGVIFLTPWRQSLAELTRVLKPGGSIYVNANGLGWYMFLWQDEHNRADDYDPKEIAARSLLDTLQYDRGGVFEPGMNLIIEPAALEVDLTKLGFVNVKIAEEGCLHLDESVAVPEKFFRGEYHGQVGVFEAIGTKR